MTMEMRELLSQVALDSSEHVSGSFTLKWLEPMVLVTPLPPKWEDLTRLVDTSSQVSVTDDAEMEDPSLEEIPATSQIPWHANSSLSPTTGTCADIQSFYHPQSISPSARVCPHCSFPSAPTASRPFPRPKQWHHLPDPVGPLHHMRPHPRLLPRNPLV